MGTHTYRQTIKYEVARDLLNGRIAVITDHIAAEEAKTRPDAKLIDELEEMMATVGRSISELDVTDEAGLDAVISSISANSEELLRSLSRIEEAARAGGFVIASRDPRP